MEHLPERGCWGCQCSLVVRERRFFLGEWIQPCDPGEPGGMEQVAREGDHTFAELLTGCVSGLRQRS